MKDIEYLSQYCRYFVFVLNVLALKDNSKVHLVIKNTPKSVLFLILIVFLFRKLIIQQYQTLQHLSQQKLFQIKFQLLKQKTLHLKSLQ